jgi:hypothetical protein
MQLIGIQYSCSRLEEEEKPRRRSTLSRCGLVFRQKPLVHFSHLFSRVKERSQDIAYLERMFNSENIYQIDQTREEEALEVGLGMFSHIVLLFSRIYLKGLLS